MHRRSEMKICTHDGVFHADEVLAIALLTSIFWDSEFERSRNIVIWGECDILVDVGGEYVAHKENNVWPLKFDHHQNETNLPTHSDGTPMSSLGLVFDYFKETLIGRWDSDAAVCRTGDEFNRFLPFCQQKFIDYLVKPVDAWDNGVPGQSCPAISSIISSYNTSWYETEPGLQDKRFIQALGFATDYIDNVIRRIVGEFKAVSLAEKIDRSKKGLMVLPTFFPWQSYTTEEDVFCVFPNLNGGWNAQAVPIKPGGRELKQKLPEKWLNEKPEGCSFVHKGLYIAVFDSKEHALNAIESIL